MDKELTFAETPGSNQRKQKRVAWRMNMYLPLVDSVHESCTLRKRRGYVDCTGIPTSAHAVASLVSVPYSYLSGIHKGAPWRLAHSGSSNAAIYAKTSFARIQSDIKALHK